MSIVPRYLSTRDADLPFQARGDELRDGLGDVVGIGRVGDARQLDEVAQPPERHHVAQHRVLAPQLQDDVQVAGAVGCRLACQLCRQLLDRGVGEVLELHDGGPEVSTTDELRHRWCDELLLLRRRDVLVEAEGLEPPELVHVQEGRVRVEGRSCPLVEILDAEPLVKHLFVEEVLVEGEPVAVRRLHLGPVALEAEVVDRRLLVLRLDERELGQRAASPAMSSESRPLFASHANFTAA